MINCKIKMTVIFIEFMFNIIIKEKYRVIEILQYADVKGEGIRRKKWSQFQFSSLACTCSIC